jgi:hypothetical protein
MKYTFLLCLFSGLLAINVNGQDKLLMLSSPEKKKEIRKTLNTYLSFTKTKEYDKILDYVHPKLFDVVSREAILQQFEAMESDESMKITFGEALIKDISDLVRVGPRYFSLVFYQFEMTMTFQDKAMAPVMKDAFVSTFGEDNVKLDEEKGAIEVMTHKSLFAIEEPDLNGWKVIENNPEQRFILESILPTDVIEHYKSYYPNGN